MASHDKSTMEEFFKVSYLLTPLLLGLTIHGLCIKYEWLRSLARPIDGGLVLRGRRLFGNNKTYRGVAAVAFGTAAGVAMQVVLHRLGVARHLELLDYSRPSIIALGLVLGTAAMLSELLNSLLKRQIGITPGAAVGGTWGALFYVLDQVDMLIGIWIVLSFVVGVTGVRVLWSVLFLFIAHQLLTVIGYQLGMRATSR
jgi:CDP-archaeol synthase